MDKNAIKKYAIWARRELISRVSQKAAQYAITDGDIADANAETVNGIVLTNTEKTQRRNLIAKIREKGYEQVMEEIAYTWFNRFCALRFMEVNNYLPSHIRVFTNEDNEFRPQIIDEAIHLELEGLNMQTVYAFKEANDNEGLYKYLIITQCNSLGKILPGMFEHISDYTELLFPDNILREGSVIEQMITLIPQEDWQDAVQIIGWLYQYYNTEPKDKVFADLKKNIKISKENIPAATQLFTPDWIVRYMVENSVGRWYYDGMQGWLQDSPDVNRLETLKLNWKYYIDEAEQTEEVQAELEKLRSEKCPDLDDFKVIDPCMGSGHILVYAFDVLMQIYLSCGYSERDSVKNIVEKNLYGLDIDDRAAQLAYFAVMMKARQYDRRFFARALSPNVYSIPESNNIDKNILDDFINQNETIKDNIGSILSDMHDAKEYGSIINATPVDFDCLYARINELSEQIGIFNTNFKTELFPLIKVAEMLSQKYDAVVTNPPYVGANGMGSKLSEYVKEHFPDSKSDLFAVFIERCINMTKKHSFTSLITMQVWMFIASYEKLRNKLINKYDVENLIQIGFNSFPELNSKFALASAFCFRKVKIKNRSGVYFNLNTKDLSEDKEKVFFRLKQNNEQINCCMETFSVVPGNTFAYWISSNMLNDFKNKVLGDICPPRQGIATADNDRFLRLWYEVNNNKISIFSTNINSKWFPYNKGGDFRKWYGNNEYLVNWENDGFELHNNKASVLRNQECYFKEGITWSLVNLIFGSRYFGEGHLFDVGGSGVFPRKEDIHYILGLMNSKITSEVLKILNPSLNFQVGNIANIPIIWSDEYKQLINEFSKSNVQFSKKDWDSFETSWDFTIHPLVRLCHGVHDNNGNEQAFIEDAYIEWQSDCNGQFNELKANEEELNRIFIDIYGLQDELTPEVEDKDVTVHYIADTKEDAPESMRNSNYLLTKQDVIKSFISYAVGCMFGRYSLDVDGIAYAGGEWNKKYITTRTDNISGVIELPAVFTSREITHIRVDGKDIPLTYAPDDDNCIPITDEEYFSDDIVGRFCEFLKTVYGESTLEENLNFIASALGNKGNTSRSVIRNYFLNDFYADHCKIYQKRPIYWLFDSGKKNGFKALIYMHRYREDTLARMRTDYVHEQQSRYRTAIEEAERQASSAKDSERVKISKTLNKLKEQDEELRVYEEKIHHLADQMIRIDLDDGVKHNYDLFKDVLSKIK